MSPRNEVFHNPPCQRTFDASSDASETLIAAGDAEEEDYRLQGKVVSRFKFSSLLLGLLFGFFRQFSILEVNFWYRLSWGAAIAFDAAV
jgi:hypothetical protein